MPRIISLDNAAQIEDEIEQSIKHLMSTKPLSGMERKAFTPMVLTSNGNYIQPVAR